VRAACFWTTKIGRRAIRRSRPAVVLALVTLPEIAWEASLGTYLIAKGFKPSPILSGETRRPDRTTAR
jgi:hypothetical protein